MNSIVLGRAVHGIIEGDSIPPELTPYSIILYRRGRFLFDKLITEFKFEDVKQAISHSEHGRVIKAVLQMPGF